MNRVYGVALVAVDTLFDRAQCRVFKDIAVNHCSTKVTLWVSRIGFNSGAAVVVCGGVEHRWGFILNYRSGPF